MKEKERLGLRMSRPGTTFTMSLEAHPDVNCSVIIPEILISFSYGVSPSCFVECLVMEADVQRDHCMYKWSVPNYLPTYVG